MTTATTGVDEQIAILFKYQNGAMAQLFAVGQQMSSQSYSNMNNATGYESSLLRELMQANMTQDTEMGNALAQFVAGLAK